MISESVRSHCYDKLTTLYQIFCKCVIRILYIRITKRPKNYLKLNIKSKTRYSLGFLSNIFKIRISFRKLFNFINLQCLQRDSKSFFYSIIITNFQILLYIYRDNLFKYLHIFKQSSVPNASKPET